MARLTARYAIAMAGFYVMALGIVLCVSAALGPEPWDVFHVGVANAAGIPLGRSITFTGLAVIIIDLALGIRPTLCTVLNMIMIGVFVDIIDFYTPIATPATLIGQVALLALGIAVSGTGGGLYLSARLGSGPRDGMMLGLVKLTGKRIWVVESAIEVSVVVAGCFLGSPPGIGTLISAVTLGYFIETSLKVFSRYTGRLVDHPTAAPAQGASQ